MVVAYISREKIVVLIAAFFRAGSAIPIVHVRFLQGGSTDFICSCGRKLREEIF